MSALSIAAGTPDVVARRSEADVVRSAARADRDAFEELYRRHHQIAWRLAEAVAAPGVAADAVADGFAQPLRAARRQRSLTEQPFRPQLLAATYRAGMEPSRTPAPAGSADAPTATMAAFRSLPDRWRAALWLSDVEHLGAAGVAAVLGVSAPVASQLAERGRQGLLTRFAQVGVALPEHLGAVLRPLAATPPAALEATVAKRWRSAVVVDPGGRLVPMSDWLARRAPKPLLTACGGLLALGLVGLGVMTVASPPTTTGPAAAISAPSLSGSAPVNPSGRPSELFGAGSSSLIGGLPVNDNPDALVNPILAGEGSSSALSGTPGTLASPTSASTTPGSTGSTGSSGSTGGSSDSTGGTTGGGSHSTSGSGGGGSTGTGTGTGGSSGSSTIVSASPVATVTSPSGGGVSAGLVGGAIGVAATPTCTGLEVLDIATNTCVLQTTTGPSTATNPVTALGNSLGSTVTGLTGALGLGG